jgi:hypothetical protein
MVHRHRHRHRRRHRHTVFCRVSQGMREDWRASLYSFAGPKPSFELRR